MARAQFGFTNRVLTGTLTAGSQVAGLTVGQLQNAQGSDATAWRTAGAVTSAAGAWFYIDAAVSRTWRAFMLSRTNLTTSATVRWRVGPNSSGASPVYDSGAVANVAAGAVQSVICASTAVSGRYARCDIEDATNPDAYISVALAFAGPTWQPAVNLSPQSSIMANRVQDTIRSRSGAAFVTPLYYERGWNLAHDAIAYSDLWAEVLAMDRVSADGQNIAFIPDSDSANVSAESIFGLLETTADVGYVTATGEVRSWRARIVERL